MQTKLKIEGMTCGHCVRSVKQALEQVPGVQSAQVTLDPPQATVQHETGAVAALLEAVELEGYHAEET